MIILCYYDITRISLFKLNQPSWKTNYRQESLLYVQLSIWNKLPDFLKATKCQQKQAFFCRIKNKENNIATSNWFWNANNVSTIIIITVIIIIIIIIIINIWGNTMKIKPHSFFVLSLPKFSFWL